MSWLDEAADTIPKLPGEPWLVDASKEINKVSDASLDFGLKQNPSSYANTRKAAKSLDIPIDLAERNSQEVTDLAKRDDIFKKLQDSDKVKKAFNDPSFASIAHNDVDSLIKMEQTIGPIRGKEPGYISFMEGIHETSVARLQKVHQGIRMQWADLIGSERMKKDALQKIAAADTRTERYTPEFKSSTMSAVFGGVTSTVVQAPALAVGIATGGAAVPLMFMGQSVEAEAYAKYRARDASPLEALLGGMGEGAVEVATELTPMRFFTDKFGKVGVGEFLTGMLAREVPQEQIATILQDAIDTAIANPDKTWGEYARERPEAAYQTLVATVVQAGLMGTANVAASKFAGDANKAQVSTDLSKSLDSQVETAVDTEMRKHSPEEYKKFLEDAGVEDDVYLSPQDAEVFFQDNPDILNELPEEVSNAIIESLETGVDVSIPKSDYLTYLADYHDQLSEVIRNDQDGMTVKEANEWVEQGTEQFEAEAEKILSEMEQNSEFQESADRVHQSIKDQIIKTGRFTEDVADKYATLHKSFAVTMAKRLGKTPEEISDLRVKGADLGGDTFGQAAYHGSPHQFLKFQMDKIGTGEGAQAYGDGLYFAENPNVAKQYQNQLGYTEVEGRPASNARGAAHTFILEAEGDVNKAIADANSALNHWEKIDPSFSKARTIKDTVLPQLEEWKKTGAVKQRSNFYTVDIPDESIAKMLDWDKPLSEQSDVIQAAFKDSSGSLGRFSGDTGGEAYRRITGDFGKGQTQEGGSQTSSLLSGLGIPGIKYKDEMSRGTEEGTSNYVVFDENIVTIKSINDKPAEQFFQEARGTFEPDQNIIGLLEKADLSTFLHESGHYFFESMRTFANNPDSPIEVKEDMDKLLNFVGVSSLDEWNAKSHEERREGHEKVARGFEAYLFEGKAPSVELQSLFQRLRDWLLNVYKNLRSLNVELTDEVRQVFDRMLATEEQIKEKEIARSYDPLFESAEDAGMTGEQWIKYQNMDLKQRAEAVSDLESRSLRDMKWLASAKSKELKKLQKGAREKRKAVKKEVSEDVSREAIYQAIRFLKKGEVEGQEATVSNHKIDRKATREMYEGVVSGVTLKPEIDELLIAVAKSGGLSQEAAEVEGIDPANWTGRASFGENQPVFGKRIFKKDGGLGFDEMAELLTQYGYVKYDANELVDKVEMSLAGNPQYSEQVDFNKISGAIEEYVNWESLGSMLGKEGVHPDLVAEMFGLSSGDHLVRSLIEAEPLKERIENVTDQRMLEKYGDLNDPVKMDAAAEAAIHNKAHTKFLHTEMTALAKATGSRNILAKAAKDYAEQAISRKKIRDIKPSQYSSAESRAARNAEKSMGKGDRDAAAEHKRAQILNNHFFRSANNAKEDVDSILRYFKKFNEKGVRKSLDTEYMDQIDSLLENYDLKKSVSLKELDKRKSLLEWIAAQEAEKLDPIIDERMLMAKKRHYKDAPIGELRGLRDSIKNIEHLARLKNKLLTAKDKREFQARILEADESIRENANRTVEERGTPSDVVGTMGKWGRGMLAIHRKFSSYVREMDGGKDGGVVWELLTRTMNESGDNETAMTLEDSKNMAELFEPIEKIISEGGLPANIYSAKKLIPNTEISMTKEQSLMFAMNWGNEGNRQRLLDGGMTGKKAISPEEAAAILDTLSKQEWDFVQSVLDYIGTKKALIAEQERRLTGVEPKWIDPSPINTKYGTYAGGYFPAKYDVILSTRSEELEAATTLRMGMKGAFNASATRKSYTQERAKEVVGRPILLSFNTISQHLNEVSHRLAWQDWLVDANRVLKALDQPIREHYGPEALQQMRDMVRDLAEGSAQAEHEWEQALNRVRIGTTIVGLGWRFTTALIQPSGLAQSWVRVGGKWMNKGVKHYLKNPLEAGRVMDEKSKAMKDRGITMQREINEVLNTVRAGKKVTALKASYFMLIQKFQRSVDTPTWWGAYEKAQAQLNLEGAVNDAQRKEIDDRAIAMADQAVIDSQSGGQLKDLARIQRGGPALKLFTNFYSYFSATYNLNVETVRKTKLTPSSLALMAQDLVILNTVPVLFSVALRELLKNECHGEIECLVEKTGKEQLSFITAQTVFSRELGSAAEELLFGSSYGYKGPVGTSAFYEATNLGKQISQGEADMALFKAANKVAGTLLHYPAGQINATIEGIIAVENGDVEGFGTVGAVLAGPPR